MATADLKSVLIVGVGSIGERHLRCFQKTGRVSVGICEVNDALRQTVADRPGVACSFKTIDEALERSFDAAVIDTPASLHLPQSLQAVHRGMHVLIEKPLSTSLQLVNDLITAADERNVVAAVAYVLRHVLAFAAARREIVAGTFGKPLQVVVVAGQNFPSQRPAYRDTYYARRSTGGGAIQDALTHFVNLVEWIVGPMDRALADAAHLAVPGVDVEDTVHVIARRGEVLATYALNQHQAPNESTITVVCENGVVRATLQQNYWASMVEPQGSWKEHPVPAFERDDLFVKQANNFLDSIEGRATPACSLVEGVETLKANLAILRAADSPAWSTVDTGHCIIE